MDLTLGRVRGHELQEGRLVGLPVSDWRVLWSKDATHEEVELVVSHDLEVVLQGPSLAEKIVRSDGLDLSQQRDLMYGVIDAWIAKFDVLCRHHVGFN